MRFEINGTWREVGVDIRTSLLDLLRDHLQLAGTKKGCNQGACGACTVLVDGERINSCLALAVQYQGRSITTIEGLGTESVPHVRSEEPGTDSEGGGTTTLPCALISKAKLTEGSQA